MGYLWNMMARAQAAYIISDINQILPSVHHLSRTGVLYYRLCVCVCIHNYGWANGPDNGVHLRRELEEGDDQKWVERCNNSSNLPFTDDWVRAKRIIDRATTTDPRQERIERSIEEKERTDERMRDDWENKTKSKIYQNRNSWKAQNRNGNQNECAWNQEMVKFISGLGYCVH